MVRPAKAISSEVAEKIGAVACEARAGVSRPGYEIVYQDSTAVEIEKSVQVLNTIHIQTVEVVIGASVPEVIEIKHRVDGRRCLARTIAASALTPPMLKI